MPQSYDVIIVGADMPEWKPLAAGRMGCKVLC